ncbi:ASCH domain-containing protein [uncultured Martelella sp.]|uniref:ASCH domain-containing protein n=1 Tax=uncultured Martelella sp. TaxID=392331 RepID=UPI0029C7EF04|nr:ASCH domain-containing protein [uncultured Martelella sp.]
MDERRDAIISIRPPYAEAILDGAKTIELRRRIPSLSVGTTLWIYATKPVGAVIGLARVQRIVRGDPEQIWLDFGHAAAIDRVSYEAYFSGADEAIGIILADVERSEEFVEIEKLRTIREGFHPPQVLMWISGTEAQNLRQLTDGSGSLV